MNNEPVAWMSQGGDVSRSADYFVEMGFTDLIPLYTHPVKKQDTDCQYCKQGCIRCDARKQLTDEEILDLASYAGENPTKYDMIDFARAILRKAQEK
jgi:biotin synthase-like enzyme